VPNGSGAHALGGEGSGIGDQGDGAAVLGHAIVHAFEFTQQFGVVGVVLRFGSPPF
jgi:hypothetical protein